MKSFSNTVLSLLLLAIGIGIGYSFTNKSDNSLTGKVGQYTIDLPEEISQSDGHDLIAYKQGNQVVVAFADRNVIGDYQVFCSASTMYIWDRDRLVTSLSYNSSLGKIVDRDNR